MSIGINSNRARAQTTAPLQQQSRNLDSLERQLRKPAYETQKSALGQGSQPSFERVPADLPQHPPTDLELHRLHQHEHKSTSQFQELLNGYTHENQFKKNPEVGIIDSAQKNTQTAYERQGFAHPYQEPVQKNGSIESVFWPRDHIEDAAVYERSGATSHLGANMGAQDVPRTEMRETFFRHVMENLDFTAQHKIRQEKIGTPVSANQEAPETRASLLSILRNQGQGTTLNVFA